MTSSSSKSPRRRWKEWEELRESYKLELLHQSKQRHHRDSISHNVEVFWEWLRRKRLEPSSLRARHFVEYCKDLESGKLCKRVETYRQSTQANLKSAALKWVRKLYEQGRLLLDPFEEFSPRYLPKSGFKTVLTRIEVRRLLALPDPEERLGIRDLALFELAYGSGLRVGEISRLTLGCLELDRRLLHIKTSKNGWARTVPLTRSTVQALTRYLKESRPSLLKPGLPLSDYQALWFSYHRKPLAVCGMQKLMKKYSARLERSVTFHLLRHTCATHLLQAGASVGQIARLLGHESLESTALYTRVQVEETRSMLKRCHPRFG